MSCRLARYFIFFQTKTVGGNHEKHTEGFAYCRFSENRILKENMQKLEQQNEKMRVEVAKVTNREQLTQDFVLKNVEERWINWAIPYGNRMKI